MTGVSSQTVVWADEGHKNCNHYTTKIVRLQSDENTALVLGTVDTAIKEVISDTKVTLVNEETKREYNARTNREGNYRFSLLPSGTYTIIILSPGFSRFKKENLKIKNGEALQF